MKKVCRLGIIMFRISAREYAFDNKFHHFWKDHVNYVLIFVCFLKFCTSFSSHCKGVNSSNLPISSAVIKKRKKIYWVFIRFPFLLPFISCFIRYCSTNSTHPRLKLSQLMIHCLRHLFLLSPFVSLPSCGNSVLLFPNTALVYFSFCSAFSLSCSYLNVFPHSHLHPVIRQDFCSLCFMYNWFI